MNNLPAIGKTREIIKYYPEYRRKLLYIRVKHPMLINVGCTHFARFVDDEFDICINRPKNDPSTIYLNLWTKRPPENMAVDKVEYRPSFFEMDAYQRYNYMIWLLDVTKPTDIGNVYLYLCGLERKMFDGQFSAALGEILLLRRFHGNRRFRMTSNMSMFHGCLLNKKAEKLREIVNSINLKVSGNYVLNMFYSRKWPLEPVHLYALTDHYPFFKDYRELTRYKEADPRAFVDTLASVMIHEFGQPGWPFFEEFKMYRLPRKECAVFINFNLYDSMRFINYHDIINYEPFAARAREIIRLAYGVMEDWEEA